MRAAKNLRRGNRYTQETPALFLSFVCNYSDGCKGTDRLFFFIVFFLKLRIKIFMIQKSAKDFLK